MPHDTASSGVSLETPTIPGLKTTRLRREERGRVRHRDPRGVTRDGTMQYAVHWAGNFVGVLVAFDDDPGDLVHMHPADLESLGDAVRAIPPVPAGANVVSLPVRRAAPALPVVAGGGA